MALLESNTLRFCTDTFNADVVEDDAGESSTTGSKAAKKALLIPKVHHGIDCYNASAVTGFDLTGCNLPTNTDARFVFRIIDKYASTIEDKIFNGAFLVNFDYDITVDNVLKYGNTLDQLKYTNVANQTARNDIPGFVEKGIRPIIALSAAANAAEMPTVKIGIKKTTTADSKTKTFTTDEVDLTSEDLLVQITSITPNVVIKGDATYTAEVRLRGLEDNSWSDYMPLTTAIDKDAKAVQFQYTLIVNTISGNSIQMKNFIVEHTDGITKVTDGSARLYSTIMNYEVPLQMCYVVVHHEPLHDAKIEAYVNFMPRPKHRELVEIGTGTGSSKAFVLGVTDNGVTVADSNIDYSTLTLYYGDAQSTEMVQLSDEDIEYNSINSTVTYNVPNGKILFASYDYDYGVQNFRKMKAGEPQPFTPYDGTYTTRFSYTLPDDEANPADGEPMTISNVALLLTSLKGTVTEENLGKATGKTQQFTLEHRPVTGSIEFTKTNVKSYLDSETKVLFVKASKNTELKVSYKWTGEDITVYSFSAGWSVA